MLRFRLQAIPTPTWSATGLPAGLSISATTGAITGTPTVAQSASNATITASNGVSPDDSVTISFAVTTGIAPQFGAVATIPTLMVGTAIAPITLTATGDPTPVITELRSVPSRISGSDIGLGTGGWQAAARIGQRIYFFRSNVSTLSAYDFNGARQSDDDITLSIDSPSGHGLVATTNRIYLIDNGADTALAFDFSGARLATEDIALGSGIGKVQLHLEIGFIFSTIPMTLSELMICRECVKATMILRWTAEITELY